MTSSLILRFERNTAGRDFLCGDVHGHLQKLDAALASVNFDPAVDRLFLLGDMVDRGPESARVLEYLERPEIHAIRGNHESWLVDYHDNTPMAPSLVDYTRHGGAWAIAMTPDERRPYADAFRDLPVAIELETEHGLLGLVHANCAVENWENLARVLRKPGLLEPHNMETLLYALQWDRSRIDFADPTPVAGVVAVVVGHTPVERPGWIGNHLFIDTGAWLTSADDRPLVLVEASKVRPPQS